MYQDYNVVLLRLLWAFRKIPLENLYSVFTGKEDHAFAVWHWNISDKSTIRVLQYS